MVFALDVDDMGVELLESDDDSPVQPTRSVRAQSEPPNERRRRNTCRHPTHMHHLMRLPSPHMPDLVFV
jgi:hypothetical protein